MQRHKSIAQGICRPIVEEIKKTEWKKKKVMRISALNDWTGSHFWLMTEFDVLAA